jgi:predicted dehydrogenase
MKIFKKLILVILISTIYACSPSEMKNSTDQPLSDSLIRIMTLDPGHFHAGLIHKSKYPSVDSVIHVFAPEGEELKDYLNRIAGYNSRQESPTSWSLEVYTGADYLQKMVSQKPGNVMVVAGKNDRKIDYIRQAISNGIHVYADKPLVINGSGFQELVKIFEEAESKNLLLFDIMTERFEITTLLQKELSMIPEIFGTLETGTPQNPAITKESVHHYFKYVSGQPLIRPDWFFDVAIEGNGLVDVTTHLVDLVQWEAFPEQVLDTVDVVMGEVKLWPTSLNLEQFQKVTGKSDFPEFLKKELKNGELEVFGNGEMNYTLKGKHAKVSVTWAFQAPEGTADTHYSMMRGTQANLIIRQGKAENYKPALYVKLLDAEEKILEKAIKEQLQSKYPGIDLKKTDKGEFQILVPDLYHNGHEAHFAQVTERFLDYFKAGAMPAWEVPNMIVKYYTTTRAMELAKRKYTK